MKELNEIQEEAGRENLLSNFSQTSIGSNGITNGTSSMLLEPETHHTAQEQLVDEVKGIYADLVMVEKKYTQIE